MRIKITKDFVVGMLLGACGTLWVTAKKFADVIRQNDYKDDDLDEFLKKLVDNPEEKDYCDLDLDESLK